MKKLLCMLLCVMLVVTMMPAMAWAENAQATDDAGSTETQKEYQLLIHTGPSLTNWLPGDGNIGVELREKDSNGKFVVSHDDYKIGVNATVVKHSEECGNVGIHANSIFGSDALNRDESGYDYKTAGTDIFISIPETCKKGCKFLLEMYSLFPVEVETESQTVIEYKPVGNITASTTIDVTDVIYRIDVSDSIRGKYGLGDIVDFKNSVSVMTRTIENRVWAELENPAVEMDCDWTRWEKVTEQENASGSICNLKKLVPYGDRVILNYKDANGNVVASSDCGFDGYNFKAELNYNGNETVYIDSVSATYNVTINPGLTSDTKHGIEFVLGIMNNGVITPFESRVDFLNM